MRNGSQQDSRSIRLSEKLQVGTKEKENSSTERKGTARSAGPEHRSHFANVFLKAGHWP